MTLIASKLSKVVPFSCCALFLYEEENDVLRCRFAHGHRRRAGAGRDHQGGYGLVGWVARNRRAARERAAECRPGGGSRARRATRLQSP